MIEVVEKPSVSVLDPVRHLRLMADIDHIAGVAGINPSYIRHSMIPHCDSVEVDYVMNFRLYRDTVSGLLLVGKTDIEERCFAICGAFIRNFIDARVVTLTTLLDAAESHATPDPTVLLVPNFYMSAYGKTLPAWKIATIYDILLQRAAENKQTILGMDNFAAMKQSYGGSIVNHLKKYKGTE
jgi:hypothetical protein